MSSDEAQLKERGRQFDAEKWHLPKRFRLQSELLALPLDELKERDPEMFALWERTKKEQATLAVAAASPFGTMSPQDMERARSVTIAENLRDRLYGLNRLLSASIVSGGNDVDDLQVARIAVRHELAERQAVIGRYDLATENEPDPAYRDEYLAILEAIWRDDEETCDCGEHRGSGQQAEISVPQSYVKMDVFSLKHAKVVSLMKCNKCGFMNAVDTPAEISRMRAHRARAQQLAGHLGPEEAGNLLRQRGHSTNGLMKK